MGLNRLGVLGMTIGNKPSNLRQLLKLAFYCIAILLSSTILALLCPVNSSSYIELPTTSALLTSTKKGDAAKLVLQMSPIDEDVAAQKEKDLIGNLRRRYLSGPGSSPPLCTSKCAKCTPCKPVHIPVQPGIPKPTEYYPEAWRCKCRNRLYTP